MLVRARALVLGVAMVVGAGLALPNHAAVAGPHYGSGRAANAVKNCNSPSSTGRKPSKYNRTPKGAGPWQVPLDPCNTEATGSGGVTPYYNCAYWAAEKRPDVWVHAVWIYGYSATKPGAWRIQVDARKAGFRINHHPKAGDLASWGRNATMGTTRTGVTYTASAGGHVAYVEKVRPHHQITISSMGQANDGGITVTLKYAKRKTSFIHHG